MKRSATCIVRATLKFQSSQKKIVLPAIFNSYRGLSDEVKPTINHLKHGSENNFELEIKRSMNEILGIVKNIDTEQKIHADIINKKINGEDLQRPLLASLSMPSVPGIEDTPKINERIRDLSVMSTQLQPPKSWAANNFIPNNNNGLNNILLPQYGNNMINKHQFSTKVNNEGTNYIHLYGSKIVSCLTLSNFVVACVLYNIYSINKKLEMIPNKEIIFENFQNSKINFKNYLDEKKKMKIS
mmetsp:Transcript_25998/g.24851  ORF Transcript_25998/g.24851 Transcript_25998/m.24851 type:complete len:242 (-) Transcript_25998:647-1372(-)